jgi:hypothetical protein
MHNCSRKSVVTVGVLKEYKQVIANTTADLEDHLQEIDKRLQSLSLQGRSISEEDAAERQQMQEERDSTQQCLGICAQVFMHIDQVHPNVMDNTSTSLAGSQEPVVTFRGLLSARQTTADTIKTCKEKLSVTTTQLEQHLQDLNNRLQKFSSQSPTQSKEAVDEQDRMKEEMQSIKQCLVICSQAVKQAERINDYEDISMADDGQQVVVSTIGDLISAKRVTAGNRSFQWLGQMSDESLQQLSRDRNRSATDNAAQQQTGRDTHFEGRYGTGVKLRSLNLNDEGPTGQ